MDKGLAKSSLLSGRGGCPSLPKVLFWLAQGRRGRQVWPGVFPAQCNQVTSQGAGAGVARVTGWNMGWAERAGHRSSLLYGNCCGFRVLCPASQ